MINVKSLLIYSLSLPRTTADRKHKQTSTDMNIARIKVLTLFILSLLCYLRNAIAGSSAYSVEYHSPEMCKRLEVSGVQYYFNVTKLGCMPCTQNTTFQTVSGDGLFYILTCMTFQWLRKITRHCIIGMKDLLIRSDLKQGRCKQGRRTIVTYNLPHPSPMFHSIVPTVCLLSGYLSI